MYQFTPERVEGMREQIVQFVNSLLDAQRDRGQLDIVDDLAYPLPVTVICQLLGVPSEDESRFHLWATALARSLDPEQSMSEADVKKPHEQQGKDELFYGASHTDLRSPPACSLARLPHRPGVEWRPR